MTGPGFVEFLNARLDELDSTSGAFGFDFVAADIDAKRHIFAMHGADVPGHGRWMCGTCDEHVPCQTARWLGAPFADHPDYQPAWRPRSTP